MESESFFKKFMGIIPKLLPVAVVVWLIARWFGLPANVCWGIAGCVIVYALLLSIPSKGGKFEDKSIVQNLVVKAPIAVAIGLFVWFGAGKAGFPIWWQYEFASFVFVGFLFFVTLDLKSMKQEKSAFNWVLRLLGTYALASGLFIIITAQLPQFDPQVEIEKLERKPINLASLAGPEVIAAGRVIFEENKCFNCHKVFWEGNSDRGPNLGTKQIGLYSEDYIKEQIIDPRAKQSPGFEDPKSKKAMPTYYGEDLSKADMTALIAYLKTMRDPTAIPVEGKFPDQWTWWDDEQIIAEGQKVFEGVEEATEGLNCSVCHGKDGIPLMTGALDFRNGDAPDTDKMPDQLKGVKMNDWPDDLWYKRVTRGVDNTPMAPWGTIFPHLYLWKAEAYARTFHDPLDKRTEKRPVPPPPTKEEVQKWKDDGLFLEPLL